MYKISILALLTLFGAFRSAAALHKLSGNLKDSTGAPVAGASVSLLDPADSTLSVFAISDDAGRFFMPHVKDGDFLLQVAMMGYYTEYLRVSAGPLPEIHLGDILLKTNEMGTMLNEVVITGERVPLRVKGDTLEYDAGSYKVKPNAVVEDLLRKLPGIQVDQQGNIRAMGKNVNKILVDGKEFFGDDPKMATKNLPADAVEKVQAFEKKSDGSLFSGIDDGAREQTLNLILKDGKKTGYFGELYGGLGLPEQYDASAKAFQFRPGSQLAVLGMLNNVNKFGFTFQDYVNFNGGLSSMMREGSNLSIRAEDATFDFGQGQPEGKTTSGAVGMNYMIEPWEKCRLTLNYMGNGADKLLDRYVSGKNYTPQGYFVQEDRSASNDRKWNHRMKAYWRVERGSADLFIGNVYGLLGNGSTVSSSRSAAYSTGQLENSLDHRSDGKNGAGEGGGEWGWIRKRSGKWPMTQISLQGAYRRNQQNNQWHNLASYPNRGTEVVDEQFQDNDLWNVSGSAKATTVRSLGNGFFLAPFLKGMLDREANHRAQGPLANGHMAIDSLSPTSGRSVFQLLAGLELKRNKKNAQWSIGLSGDRLWLRPWFHDRATGQRAYHYLLPSAFWQKDIKTSSRLGMRYVTSVNAPGALQLQPATDYYNPLLRAKGNPALKPAYAHNLNLSYNSFQQFSMTTFFVMLDANYTLDNINWSRNIGPDLSQDLQTVNTAYAGRLRASAQYGRPVRKLGLHMDLGLIESWDKTISPVNGVDNISETWAHKAVLDLNNLDNNVWDLRLGASLQLSDSRFSLNRELNNTYLNYTGTGSVAYQLGTRWRFSMSCNVTRYTASSFDKPITVPLLGAEICRYFFADQRAALAIKAFDLLDKNQVVQRTGQLNAILEQRSNTIGRYGLLSFTYKLNKVGGKNLPPVNEIRM